MTPEERKIDELGDILLTLFHSYDARGNDLAIDSAKDQIYKAVMEVIDTDIEIIEAFSDHISNHLTPTDMVKVVGLVRQTQLAKLDKLFGRDK